MNIVVSFFYSLTLCLAICSVSRGICQSVVSFWTKCNSIMLYDVACSESARHTKVVISQHMMGSVCINHAPAASAGGWTAPALIYSTHRLLVVWIIVVHFHLCSLLDRYTALEVWAVRRPMRVCCGSRRGRCMLFTNMLDSLMAPCLVYSTAMYIQYTAGAASMAGACSYTGQCGRCVVYTDPTIGH